MYVAGILIAAGAATAIYLTWKPAEQPAAASLSTRTAKAFKGNIETKVSGSGIAEVAEVNNVKAAYKGSISKINFKVGDQVKKGQTLVTFKKIDNSEKIKQTELSLKKQQLQMQQLQNQYKEASEENRESIKVNIESLTLEMEQNESTLASLQAEEAENHDVVAPASGTVKESQIEIGNDVNENTVVAVIADYSNLEFVMSADELDIPSIQTGQTATVTLNAFPGKEFSGKIDAIGKEGKSSNGVATYDVNIRLSKAEGVLAGMSGQAEIVTKAKQDVVLVPVEAVITMGNKHFVRVPEGDGNSSSASNGTKDSTNSSEHSNAAGASEQNGTMRAPRNADSGNASSDWSRANRNKTGASTTESGNQGAGTSQENIRSNGHMGQPGAISGVLKEVTIGISNDAYAEITSGLQTGDSVLIPTPQGKVGSSDSSATVRQRQSGGMGIGGGFGGAGFTGGSMGNSRGGRQ